jgi:hypothetical protein
VVPNRSNIIEPSLGGQSFVFHGGQKYIKIQISSTSQATISYKTKEKLPFEEVEIAAMAPDFIVFLMSPTHHLELVVFAPPLYMLKPKIIHACLLS